MVIREWLRKCPLIAILRGIETHEVEQVFTELLAAGVVIAEIPLNSPEPLRSIKRAAEMFGTRMLVGAGTVTHAPQVEQVRAAGARLVVSPNADAEIVREAKRARLIAMPGVATATEALAMVRAGADALKLFPADVLGVRLMQALRTVLPKGTLMVPVGGMDEQSLPLWHDAGAEGFGVGSSLYKPGASAGETGAHARRLLESLNVLIDMQKTAE